LGWIYPRQEFSSITSTSFYFRLNDDYLNNEDIFNCPSDEDFAFDNQNLSYGYNSVGTVYNPGVELSNGFGWHFENPDSPAIKVSQVKCPSTSIHIADSNDNEDNYWGFIIAPYSLEPSAVVGKKHSGGANILWADGHVKWQLYSAIDDTEDWWDKDK